MTRQIVCNRADAILDLFSTIDRDTCASNGGLVWNRYLRLWLWRDGTPPTMKKDAERRDALVAFASTYSDRARLTESNAAMLLKAIHARQGHILARWRSGGHGETLECALAARFATGLGAPHPSENGFTFDRSIGVPYLPGSSVKGLARAAARLCSDPSIETLFGPDRIDRDGDAKTGDLIFLDAYPAALPPLEVDIINCHHPDYYAEESPYPSETEDPNPVYFLTVSSGTKWIFRLLSRSGEHAAQGANLLRFGLKELGAGAKTAVGYGSFEPPPTAR